MPYRLATAHYSMAFSQTKGIIAKSLDCFLYIITAFRRNKQIGDPSEMEPALQPPVLDHRIAAVPVFALRG
ncbi:MAG: hypothetical protein ACLVMF_03170 [Christensenellales bacterium]